MAIFQAYLALFLMLGLGSYPLDFVGRLFCGTVNQVRRKLFTQLWKQKRMIGYLNS